MNIRIIVAEDNDVLLEDLCQELNGQPDFQVVATTSSGVGAVEAPQPPFTRRSLRRRSSTSPPTTTMT